MRTFVLSLVAAAAVAAPAAAAPACNLVPDRAGDAYVLAGATGMSAKPLDIRGVDVATGRKTLVVVLRMSSTKPADDPATASGMSAEVTFTIGGVEHRFGRRTTYTAASQTATAGGKAVAGVRVRTDGNAVTWTVPRASLPALKKPGARFTSFFASTYSNVGHDYAPDSATVSKATYKDRAPSCVQAA